MSSTRSCAVKDTGAAHASSVRQPIANVTAPHGRHKTTLAPPRHQYGSGRRCRHGWTSRPTLSPPLAASGPDRDRGHDISRRSPPPTGSARHAAAGHSTASSPWGHGRPPKQRAALDRTAHDHHRRRIPMPTSHLDAEHRPHGRQPRGGRAQKQGLATSRPAASATTQPQCRRRLPATPPGNGSSATASSGGGPRMRPKAPRSISKAGSMGRRRVRKQRPPRCAAEKIPPTCLAAIDVHQHLQQAPAVNHKQGRRRRRQRRMADQRWCVERRREVGRHGRSKTQRHQK